MENIPLLPDQASTFAADVDLLFFALLGISGLITAGVVTAIVIFIVRYRRGSDAPRGAAPINTLKLEAVWIIIPFVLSMGIYVWAASLYFQMFRPPDDALEINVVGQQWMWKFQHPEGQREINELHVPVGRPVKLLLISQDVIHSFYVPAFRIKQDALPGQYTTVWFEATRPGEYHLFCAEYCGTDHAKMVGTVIALDPAGYQQWLAEQDGGPSVASAGEQLFLDLGCQSCHRPPGAAAEGQRRAPSLVGLFGTSVTLASGETVTADEGYIRRSILNPQAQIVAGFRPIMPTYEGQVSEEDLTALIDYIRSLENGNSENE